MEKAKEFNEIIKNAKSLEETKQGFWRVMKDCTEVNDVASVCGLAVYDLYNTIHRIDTVLAVVVNNQKIIMEKLNESKSNDENE